MKKKRKHGRRRHRRNPSDHPILVGLATVLLEGIAGWVITSTVGYKAASAWYPAQMGGTLIVTAGGGYAIGRHFWPQNKNAILVGSIISAILGGVASVSRRRAAIGLDAANATHQVTS